MRILLSIILAFCLVGVAAANKALDDINAILKKRESLLINNTSEVDASKTQNMAINGRDKVMMNDLSLGKTPITKNISQDYKFIVFIRSDCPHCKRFNPVLKQYSLVSHIPVEAYSFSIVGTQDTNTAFPDSKSINPALARQYFGDEDIAVPTLFIMHTQNMHVFPVSRGELSFEELDARMNILIPNIMQVEGNAHV